MCLLVFEHKWSLDLPLRERANAGSVMPASRDRLADRAEIRMLEVFRKVAFRFGGRPRYDTTVVDGERRHRVDGERRHRSASRAERIKATCDLGRMHARSMRDRSLAPELAASERKSYELYKRDAIALARRVTDPVLRDHALGHLIDLCIDGGSMANRTGMQTFASETPAPLPLLSAFIEALAHMRARYDVNDDDHARMRRA